VEVGSGGLSFFFLCGDEALGKGLLPAQHLEVSDAYTELQAKRIDEDFIFLRESAKFIGEVKGAKANASVA
jgi:hypothetical protein